MNQSHRTEIDPLEPRVLFAAGEIDPYFGNKGSIGLSNSNVISDDIAVQPNGAFIVASVESLPTDPIKHITRLRRFRSNGSVDPSFHSPLDDQPTPLDHPSDVD